MNDITLHLLVSLVVETWIVDVLEMLVDCYVDVVVKHYVIFIKLTIGNYEAENVINPVIDEVYLVILHRFIMVKVAL